MSASENVLKYFLEKRKKYETFFNLKFSFFQSVLEMLNYQFSKNNFYFFIFPLAFFEKGTFKVVPLIGFWNKIKEILRFPVLYLGELQTTSKCIKLEKKSPESTHPTVYTCIILSTP